MSSVKLFSECFCSTDIHNHYVVTPSITLWQKWMEDNPRANRLFIRIYHPDRIDDEDTFLAPIGDPVDVEDERNSIYLPTWMIDSNKYQGAGEEAVIEIVNIDELPRATKITLRPVDSALHEVDVVKVFENSFSRMGVLKQGKLYLIPLEELGGYEVSVYVSKLEPAEEVYLDGDEVPLEFERPVDYVEPPPRPLTPIPEPPQTLHPDLMVPSNFLGDNTGNRVVTPHPNGQQRRTQNHCPRGFIPFSGTGHTLGGK